MYVEECGTSGDQLNSMRSRRIPGSLGQSTSMLLVAGLNSQAPETRGRAFTAQRSHGPATAM